MATTDEYGIIPAIVVWQTDHPATMLPPHAFDVDPATDQIVTLIDDTVANKKCISNVHKRVLPLMVAVGLGREANYLAKLISHHQITYQDIKDCYWNSDFSVVLAGTHHSFKDNDLSIAFFQAVNACPDLKNHAELEIYEDKTEVGLIFLEDPAFSIKDRYLNADFEAEKNSLMKLSTQIVTTIDFSKEQYWADGDVGKLIECAGGYLPDVLFGDQLHRRQPDLDPDFWYCLLKDTARELEPDDRVHYLRKILTSVDKNDSALFYKGLRTIEAYAEVENDILEELKDFETALGSNARSVITDLQLLKGIVDPSDAGKALAKYGYTSRFESKLFVHNVFTELLSVDQREINHADLKAFSKIHLMGNDQDLSKVDVLNVLVHVLSAYDNKCDHFKETAQITDGLIKTVAYLKDLLPAELEWIDGLGEEALQLLAMAGFNTHKKMSLQSLGKVFSYDLNL
ncbi:hypothetical protein [Pseudomonas serbica]|uniref:hypothetical protein n=1 Tax=Pseudomonas serbica TaxID=2965074 RepID=UPI00237B56BA|nr:hypothetical protein [Pseudomonas serbica]